MSNFDDEWDRLLFLENEAMEKGYESGVATARETAYRDGFALGVQKGYEIGAEVGFYLDFCAWIQNTQTSNNKRYFCV